VRPRVVGPRQDAVHEAPKPPPPPLHKEETKLKKTLRKNRGAGAQGEIASKV